ncbi:MAG: thiamine phosphate synthase [Pseudomonadota bacterium]
MAKNPATPGGKMSCAPFSSSLDRLMRRARQLGGGHGLVHGRAYGRAFPYRLLVMSDAQRLPGLGQLIAQLPRDSAVIFRDYSDPERTIMGKRLRALCARHAVGFLVAGDPGLARRLGADGLHVPGWLLRHPGRWSGVARTVTAACHSLADINRAARCGAQAALLSPVFPTQSHPGALALGRQRFLALASRAPLPVFALGGVTADNAARLRATGVAGLAVISAVR